MSAQTVRATKHIVHKDCGGTMKPMKHLKHEVIVLETSMGRVIFKQGDPKIYHCDRCDIRGELV